MSKTLFSFMIGELTVIRLMCKHDKCGAITEIPTTRLSKNKPLKCPSCQMPYEWEDESPLRMLGRAIQMLKENQELGVEFVLPVRDE
jgi:hypothetical protein